MEHPKPNIISQGQFRKTVIVIHQKIEREISPPCCPPNGGQIPLPAGDIYHIRIREKRQNIPLTEGERSVGPGGGNTCFIYLAHGTIRPIMGFTTA